MAINKRVELSWDGESYPVLVTMEVIERIEERQNLAKLAQDCAKGDVKFSHAARLVATLLNEGGASVSVDDVYEGMFADGATSGAAVVGMMSDILGAVFPPPKKKPTSSSKRRKTGK